MIWSWRRGDDEGNWTSISLEYDEIIFVPFLPFISKYIGKLCSQKKSLFVIIIRGSRLLNLDWISLLYTLYLLLTVSYIDKAGSYNKLEGRSYLLTEMGIRGKLSESVGHVNDMRKVPEYSHNTLTFKPTDGGHPPKLLL